MDVLFSLADGPSAFKPSNPHGSLGKSLHTTQKGNSCGEMSVEKKFSCSEPCTGASLISLSKRFQACGSLFSGDKTFRWFGFFFKSSFRKKLYFTFEED